MSIRLGRLEVGTLVHFKYLSDELIHGFITDRKFILSTEQYEYCITVNGGDSRWISEGNIWL